MLKQLIKDTLISGLTTTLGDKEGYVTLPTLSGPNRGLKFRLNLKQFIEPNYLLGRYESSVVNVVSRICKKDWVVWDCGIYLGYYTALFGRLAKQVVAFEPDPRNLQRTRENLRRNGITNVSLVSAAVGEPQTEVEFVISNDTNSHIEGAFIGSDRGDYATRARHDGLIRVRSLSLDEALGEFPAPDLIKLDIEGAEGIALGYTDKLCRDAKPIMIVELHNPECDLAAWKFSKRVNYKLTSLDTGQTITSSDQVTGALLCEPLR